MKNIHILIYLLLQVTLSNAQYPAPLPSSGQISILQISNWMRAAGEIGNATYSLSALKAASHLANRTAPPFKFSDWYGYSVPCIASVAGVSTSVGIYAGSWADVTLEGGSLGTGAVWTWSAGSPTGPAIGTGRTLNIQSPDWWMNYAVYYVTARGGCHAAIEAVAEIWVWYED